MTALSTLQVGDTVERGKATLPRGCRIIKVYRDSAGKFRWRLRYQHNTLSDSGQGYNARPAAVDAARRNAVPVGDFPVVLDYERRTGGDVVWERIR
ncbi:DUF1508 domain-containing protein [Mycolicibacterium sp. A43C]